MHHEHSVRQNQASDLIFTVFILFVVSDAWIEEPSSGLRPVKRNSDTKCLSRSLRLSNNNITDLHDLQKAVNHFLAEPSQLAWLDLSFNNISHIDQVSKRPPLHGLFACLLPRGGLAAFLLSVAVRPQCVFIYVLVFQVLCELRELRVLYLHGNSIYILSEVERLGVLPHLHTITLHGNVIETNKAYRWSKFTPKTQTHTHTHILLSCTMLTSLPLF